MRNDISPTFCLPFESESAKALHWLPLAVRYKLDGAGLRLTLDQWQALPLDTRSDLLRRMPAEGFAVEALKVGAGSSNLKTVQRDVDEKDIARLLGCSLADGRAWLAEASKFARYAMGKRMRSNEAGRRVEGVRQESADASTIVSVDQKN